MKQTRRLINGLVACAVAFAMVSTVAAQDGTAKVIRMKGPARYSTGNNVWQPVKVGTVLHSGTVIQTSTERGSFVDLGFGDGVAPIDSAVIYKPTIPNSMSLGLGGQAAAGADVVRLFENTALGIDKLVVTQTGAEEVTDTQLDLKAGHIAGAVKKLSAASKYEVKLPNGVVGIRGTVFDITADGVVRVMVGSMVLAWVDPKSGNVTTQVVMGGQQYDARTGQTSPIPSSELSLFERTITTMRGTAVTPVTTQAPDRTLVHLSPVGGAVPGPGSTPGGEPIDVFSRPVPPAR